MGQGQPAGFRLGITTDWKSRCRSSEYADNVVEDWKIRDYLLNEPLHAAISRVEVERTRERLRRRAHRPSGHRDRPPWCRGRPPPCWPHEDLGQPEGPARDQAARARRCADRPGSRPARRPCGVPTREKRAVQNACEGRRLVFESNRRPPRRFGDGPHRGYREGRAAAHPVPMSTTASARPDHLRPYRREGVALQAHPSLQVPDRGQGHPRGGDGCRRDVGPSTKPARSCPAPPASASPPPRPRVRTTRSTKSRLRSSRKPIPNSNDCSMRRTPSRPPPVSSPRPRTSGPTTEVSIMLMPKKVKHRKHHRDE